MLGGSAGDGTDESVVSRVLEDSVRFVSIGVGSSGARRGGFRADDGADQATFNKIPEVETARFDDAVLLVVGDDQVLEVGSFALNFSAELHRSTTPEAEFGGVLRDEVGTFRCPLGEGLGALGRTLKTLVALVDFAPRCLAVVVSGADLVKAVVLGVEVGPSDVVLLTALDEELRASLFVEEEGVCHVADSFAIFFLVFFGESVRSVLGLFEVAPAVSRELAGLGEGETVEFADGGVGFSGRGELDEGGNGVARRFIADELDVDGSLAKNLSDCTSEDFEEGSLFRGSDIVGEIVHDDVAVHVEFHFFIFCC